MILVQQATETTLAHRMHYDTENVTQFVTICDIRESVTLEIIERLVNK